MAEVEANSEAAPESQLFALQEQPSSLSLLEASSYVTEQDLGKRQSRLDCPLTTKQKMTEVHTELP